MTTPEIALSTVTLQSDCNVTLSVGTNYAQTRQAPRPSVQTFFSLRFDKAHPLKIKGIKDESALIGFELSLAGPDELRQLIKALELAASELRWQANLAAEPEPAMPNLDQTQLREQAENEAAAAEYDVLYLLLFFGSRPVAGGPTVARYLRAKLRQLPPSATPATTACWEALLGALATAITPTPEWLRAKVGGDNQTVQSLEKEAVATLGPATFYLEPTGLRARCGRAVHRHYRAALRVLQLDLLWKLETTTAEGDRLPLLARLRDLDSQLAYLASQQPSV